MNPAHRRRHARANARAARKNRTVSSAEKSRPAEVVQRYNHSVKRWQKLDAANGDVIATKRDKGPYKDIARG